MNQSDVLIRLESGIEPKSTYTCANGTQRPVAPYACFKKEENEKNSNCTNLQELQKPDVEHEEQELMTERLIAFTISPR